MISFKQFIGARKMSQIENVQKFCSEISETMEKCAYVAENIHLIPESFKRALIYENLQKIPKQGLQKLVKDLECVFDRDIKKFLE